MAGNMAGIGLNAGQIAAVKSTWALVEKDLKQHGVNVFVRIFRTHPDAQQLFKRMKDKSVDELETSPVLRAHALGFMKELSGMIENLENTDELVIAVENNALRHHKRKVTVGHYEAVFKIYHQYLKDTLGGAFTADADSGWALVEKAIVATVDKEYKDIEK